MGAIIPGHSLVCFLGVPEPVATVRDILEEEGKTAYSVLALLQVLQITLNDNQRCREQCEPLTRQVEELHQDFREFEKCETKSELCLLSGVWLQLVADIKSAVASEREGPWNQLAATVEDSMPIYAE